MIDFEEGLLKLEQIVNKLERGDLPLEHAIEIFEEGMRLSQVCSQKIESAQQRVDILVQEQGEWLAQPFETVEQADS